MQLVCSASKWYMYKVSNIRTPTARQDGPNCPFVGFGELDRRVELTERKTKTHLLHEGKVLL